MSDATTQPRSNTSAGTISGATIRADEAAHFGKLAKDWWDPKGSSAMLHRLNPVRLQFLREAIDLHWAGDIEARRPLAGKSALDVGCGAGLLCEPLARLGADVTGVDAAPEPRLTTVTQGNLESGFAFPGVGLALLTEHDLTGSRGTTMRDAVKMPARRRNAVDLVQLQPGDLVEYHATYANGSH